MSELEPIISPVPGVEDEKPLSFQDTLRRFYEIMRGHEIYAVRAFFASKIFDLENIDPMVEEELEAQFMDKVVNSGGPYVVFEGAHPDPDRQTVSVKIKLDRLDVRHTAENELYFYQELRPSIEESMPSDITHIKVPELLTGGHSEEGYSYFITEFAEGEQIGNKFYDAENPLSIEEFSELAKFIRYFQNTFTPEKVSELAPDIEQNALGAVSTYEMHEKRLEGHQQSISELAGPEYAEKMWEILRENEDLLKNSPSVCTNQDICASNLIRSGEDIYVIDWERIKTVPNAAAAYCQIIDGHWRFPELQHAMIEEVLSLNRDIPNFKQLFRLNMIFYKYTAGYMGRSKESSSEDEQAGAAAYIRTLKEAVDETGPWEN